MNAPRRNGIGAMNGRGMLICHRVRRRDLSNANVSRSSCALEVWFAPLLRGVTLLSCLRSRFLVGGQCCQELLVATALNISWPCKKRVCCMMPHVALQPIMSLWDPAYLPSWIQILVIKAAQDPRELQKGVSSHVKHLVALSTFMVFKESNRNSNKS